MFLLHHVIFSITIFLLSISNKYHAFIATGLLTEVSTICFNIHALYRLLAKYNAGLINNNYKNLQKSIYYDNISHKLFNLFGILFFVIRICFIGIIVIFNFTKLYELNFLLTFISIFIMLLNSIWMISIFKAIINYRKINQ